jgi:choline dehydrogenase-like flavoprotein
MAQTERYEVLTIGSGEAGKYMAWTMAKAGHRTAVVERRLVGGSCPNIACLPSKNIIHSADPCALPGRERRINHRSDRLISRCRPNAEHSRHWTRPGRCGVGWERLHKGQRAIRNHCLEYLGHGRFAARISRT